MNREILFRGKRIDMNKWTYGCYTRHETQQPGAIGDGLKQYETQHMIMHSGFIADWNMTKTLCYTYVDPETVGQFTGLYDADGNRIFEGDIIKGKRGPAYVVEYRESIAGYLARAVAETPWTPCMNTGTMKYYRIIGNRWDNPELLAPGEQQQEMQGVI